ncbi:hypothetical protein [Sphingobium sp. LSP13-1-1.1]|uniref:hypothetical protein n=1 Tax=Sphingobium sp. LSP13-1-1.1 TaxID=3135234 RepID=UPI003447E44F
MAQMDKSLNITLNKGEDSTIEWDAINPDDSVFDISNLDVRFEIKGKPAILAVPNPNNPAGVAFEFSEALIATLSAKPVPYRVRIHHLDAAYRLPARKPRKHRSALSRSQALDIRSAGHSGRHGRDRQGSWRAYTKAGKWFLGAAYHQHQHRFIHRFSTVGISGTIKLFRH